MKDALYHWLDVCKAVALTIQLLPSIWRMHNGVHRPLRKASERTIYVVLEHFAPDENGPKQGFVGELYEEARIEYAVRKQIGTWKGPKPDA